MSFISNITIEWCYSWHIYICIYIYYHIQAYSSILLVNICRLILQCNLSWFHLCILEEYSRLPTGRRIAPLPTEGSTVVATMGLIKGHNPSHKIDQSSYEQILRNTADRLAYVRVFKVSILLLSTSSHDLQAIVIINISKSHSHIKQWSISHIHIKQ